MAKNKKNLVAPATACCEPKSVRIEKAENGYTVSMWTEKGNKQMVAKTETEAIRHAKNLLGAEPKKAK